MEPAVFSGIIESGIIDSAFLYFYYNISINFDYRLLNLREFIIHRNYMYLPQIDF